MKLLFTSLLLVASLNAMAGDSIQNLAQKFYNKHKNAYLYCQNLTQATALATQQCFPLKSLTLTFEDLPNNYTALAEYEGEKLRLRFDKNITPSALTNELLIYSDRLLDPL